MHFDTIRNIIKSSLVANSRANNLHKLFIFGNMNTAEISVIFTLRSQMPETIARLANDLQTNGITVGMFEQRPKAAGEHGSKKCLEYLICVDRKDADRTRSIIEPQCSSYATLHRDDDSVPWYPETLADLDESSQQIFTFGVELDADHPGFLDVSYRARRMQITELAARYRMGQPIPHISYTPQELDTWNECFTGLLKLYPTHACRKYNAIRQDMFEACGYRLNNVPQLEDVSNYVQKRSGFRIRPVGGLLSPRAFLAGLAFKVYHATQYMRHHSRPFYTPEPDICHELLGHLPLFADPDFAEFVHQIGLASLGAPDEYTERLSTCLWFTVEFGLCREAGELRAFGGGLLSSVDELQYALSDQPEVRAFEPEKTGLQPFTITEFQTIYYAAESIEKARDQMVEYAATIPRPFTVRYDNEAECIVSTNK